VKFWTCRRKVGGYKVSRICFEVVKDKFRRETIYVNTRTKTAYAKIGGHLIKIGKVKGYYGSHGEIDGVELET